MADSATSLEGCQIAMKQGLGLRVSFSPPATPRCLRVPSVSLRVVKARVASVEPTEQLDFVSELRQLAMSLHTKDQAKSGQQKESPKPFQSWVYTREGYLQFLVESKHVYEAFERIVQTHDAYSLFRGTGLDRVQSLNNDIAWIASEYDLPIPSLCEDSPSVSYAKTLEEMSEENHPAFVCHFYNFYLAHTAGGRMIGKKVAKEVLFGEFDRLAFYQYDSNLKELVADLKASINSVADEWTREEKDAALSESMNSFKCVGKIMRTMFSDDA